MSALDGSIVIIALPAIFRGIHMDPLASGTFGYLLWMIMGYLLVQAVFVVTLGRLGDMMGRVKIYNLGFVVFTLASVLLSFDPFSGERGALWLIGWRLLQALGGSMLTANSAAILHRRVSFKSTRLRPRDKPDRRACGTVSRAGRRRHLGDPRLARRLLGERAGRHLRYALGLSQPARNRPPSLPAASIGGATSPSRSASARCSSP